MWKTWKSYVRDESGAVLVDWVVLTASIIGLCLVVMIAFASSLGVVTDAIGNDMADATSASDTVLNAFDGN